MTENLFLERERKEEEEEEEGDEVVAVAERSKRVTGYDGVRGDAKNHSLLLSLWHA